jgi:hypothetical protein
MVEKGLELKQQKKAEKVDIEEFKALVNNLKPTTLKQAEWICSEVDRLTTEHPELKERFKEFYTMPESERKELEEIINQIIAEAERARQK